MPQVNYCRKCKTETPLGEACPYCGAKLAQTNEQISFGVVRIPVRDWFAWNNVLRVALPVLLLVLLIAVAAEVLTDGARGVILLFSQGFFGILLSVLGAMLVLILLLLLLQGPERVHYVLDKQGVCARTYLAQPTELQMYARFLTPQGIQHLQSDSRPALDGLTLVRRVFLPWAEVRRARMWREGFTLLFFRPLFWQVLSVRCPVQELSNVEMFARKKLKRFRKVKVLPCEKIEKKQK